MSNNKFYIFKSLFALVLILTTITCNLPIVAAAQYDTTKILDGKTISILGDSISTFRNISNGTGADKTNTTIKNNRYYYGFNKNGVNVNDTWWMQIFKKLGGRLLVNNSSSGTQVFDPEFNLPSQGYLDRAVNLHDNTGSNNGETPDIILVYLGYNDFAYAQSKLGTYESINFNTLIKTNGNKVTYAQPQTSCEAYAIMIHKIKNRYPDAEVYCFNLPPRDKLTSDLLKKLTGYNNAIAKIATKFNCILVNNYNDSGINPDDNIINFYLADGIHPNKNGMDAITNSFLNAFYKNSRYMDGKAKLYPIEYKLNNVVVDQGTMKTIIENDSFFCSFSSISGAPVEAKLKLNGVDITQKCFVDGCFSLPEVTGALTVEASLKKQSATEDTYRFEITDNSLHSIKSSENFSNEVVATCGSINDTTITNGAFRLEKTIELKHNIPWTILWKAQFNNYSDSISLSNYYKFNKDFNSAIHFINNTSILAISSYENGVLTSHGIDLSKHNIDLNKSNEYRLSNVIQNGKNMIYLYINGRKIGALNSTYTDGSYTITNNTWCSKKDFYFNYIGTTDNTIKNCSLEYIQIWENINTNRHSHKYIYSNKYNPTCTENGYSEQTCICGYGKIVTTAYASGHKETRWIVDTPNNVHQSGSAHIECTVCGVTTKTKILPQLTTKAPQITSLSNEVYGIRIKWGAVEGATSYRIYRRALNDKYWSYVCTTTGLTYLDKAVKSNEYWYYTIRGVNVAGFGSYDANGKYMKFLSVPKITALSNTTTGIKIQWNKVNGAIRYYVFRNRVGLSDWTYVGSTTAASYTDSTIRNANGVDYRYSVKAYNGYTSAFDTKGCIIRRLTTPVLKTAVSYPTGIYVNWTPIAGTTGYYVYRKNGKGSWTLLGTVASSSNNTAYFDKTAKKGIKYTYTVKACYGKSVSDFYPQGISCIDKY